MIIKPHKWKLEAELDAILEKQGKKRKGKFKSTVMFSSKTDLWSTQQGLYDNLNNVFGFDLDPCSTHENAKCKKHFTIEDDGLSKSWKDYTVFCNPPYGKPLKDWIQKSADEYLKNGTTTVLLIPARTDTRYQHDIIFKYARAIVFVKGRLKFGNQKNSAPFPSQIVIFSDDDLTVKQYNALSKIGKVTYI